MRPKSQFNWLSYDCTVASTISFSSAKEAAIWPLFSSNFQLFYYIKTSYTHKLSIISSHRSNFYQTFNFNVN